MSHQEHPQPVEYKTPNTHAVLQRHKHCRMELTIKAFSGLIESARKEAVKAVSREVVLPGFRKGKAPLEIIQKKFPADVEKKLHNTLANAAFTEVQSVAKIPVLNRNTPVTFDLKHFSNEEAHLLFIFETEPTIPSVDPKLFHPTPVTRAEVGEKQINEAIRQMQFYFAKWIPMPDRPIEVGDIIVINLDTLEEGKEPTRVFNEIRFEVSKERMASWMQELVLGAKQGAVLEGLSHADDDATEEEKKEFVPKKVLIEIVRVETVELPEVNDEFAKKVGSESVEKMRQSVSDMLNRQAYDKEKEQLREQVNAFLASSYPFDLPSSLIKAEVDHRWRQLDANPDFQKDWNKMSQEEKDRLQERLANESGSALRLFYLSRQIVNDAHIGITHQEIQHEAIVTLRAQGIYSPSPDQVSKEVYALAVSKVMLAKAQDYLLSQAQTALAELKT